MLEPPRSVLERGEESLVPRTPVPAVPAATILVLRDGSEGLEVLMVERHHQIDFVAGAMVFPGGRVDPADGEHALADHCSGLDGLDDEERAFRVAAIRETFEEAGVLMARGGGADLLGGDALREVAGRHRKAIHDGSTTMLELARAESLTLAADALVPFARWITPAFMPKRFDTWFFLVVAPPDQIAAHDGIESVDSVWIRPADVIADAEAKRRQVIFPTLMNVKRLGESQSVDEALEAARRQPVVTVLPVVEKRDGEDMLILPEGAGYSLTQAPVSALRG